MERIEKGVNTIVPENIAIGKLDLNSGQIDGVPKNPRFIRDERYEALKRSIMAMPDGLALRELIVYPTGRGRYAVLAGNMRLRACRELSFDTMPCKVLPEDTPAETLRRIVIIDNVSFGQMDWDVIANEYDSSELTEFGMELDWIADPNDLPDANGGDSPDAVPGADSSDGPAESYIVQMTFNSEADRERFLAAYRAVLEADYDCVFTKA